MRSRYPLTLLVATAAWKSWPLGSGRLWAEDGTVLFAELCERSHFDALSFVFNGHLEWPANLLGLIATRTWFGVLAFGSILAAVLVALLVYRAVLSLSDARAAAAASMLAVICMPESYETWGSAVNLQFYGALLAWVLLVSTSQRLPGLQAMGALLLALTGVPAASICVLFLARAARTHSRESIARAVGMTLGASIQVGLLVSTRFGGRALEFDLPATARAITTHLIAGPLLGRFTDDVMTAVTPSLAIVLTGAWLSLAVFVAIRTWRSSPAIAEALMAAVLLVALASLAPHGSMATFDSTLAGARYFHIPLVLTFIALTLIAAGSTTPLARRAFTFTACWWVASSFTWGLTLRQSGPTMDLSQPTVAIWPEGWVMPRVACFRAPESIADEEHERRQPQHRLEQHRGHRSEREPAQQLEH